MRKKVLLVFDYLETGGGTRLTINIARSLHRIYDVYLVCGLMNESYTDLLLDEIKPFCKKIYSYPLFNTDSDSLFGLKVTINNFLLIKKITDNLRLDAIFLNLTYSSVGILLNPLSWTIKKYYIFHGLLALERESLYTQKQIKSWKTIPRIKFKSKNYFLKKLQLFLIKQCNNVFCFSNYSYNLLINNLIGIKKKLKIVNPPIFAKAVKIVKWKEKVLTTDDKTFVMTVASRVEPRKGIYYLIGVTKLFKKNNINAKIIILGAIHEFSYFTKILKLLSNHNLVGMVNFYGNVSHQKAESFLKNSDLTIMPSHTLETLGVTTLESLLLGTPVISFNSGSSPELLSGVDSRLISPKINSKSLAKTIINYINLNIKDKSIIKRKAREFVINNYSANRFINTISEYI